MKIQNTRRGFTQNAIICPPCEESVAVATKEGQKRKKSLWPLLPRLTALLPPQGREMLYGFTRSRHPELVSGSSCFMKGFTLIELLVVVLIIGILAAIAVPQYQQAVLKIRYKTLMLPAKSIHSANEVYYLAHGYYANRFKELDVDFTNEDEYILVKLSDDPEYAYVLSTRKDIDNNYIMYQKKSVNYPGEIHCEALTDDEKANKLCKILGGQEIVGSITEGYTTYVLEGTGNGMAPGVNSEGAASCDKAIEIGYTCDITKNKNDMRSKKVCQTVGGITYCSISDYDADGNKTQRTLCKVNSNTGVCETTSGYIYDKDGGLLREYRCSIVNEDGGCKYTQAQRDIEYIHNEDGSITSMLCYGSREISGSDTCLSRSDGATFRNDGVYTYDANGNKIFRACTSSRADGVCISWENGWTKYTYDAQGREIGVSRCLTGESDGSSCSNYSYTNVYEYDTDGNKIKQSQCSTAATLSSDGSCSAFSSVQNYVYEDGKLKSYRSCSGSNINAEGDCASYNGMGIDYTYDAMGNRTMKRCDAVNSAGDCPYYNYVGTTIFDEEGNSMS